MRNIIALTILTAICLLGASACSSNQKTVTEPVTSVIEGESSTVTESETSVIVEESKVAEYKKISAEEAKAMIDAGNVIILDVRTQEEYDVGHISGAIRLESADFAAQAATVLPDKDATILVYCRSGKRSKVASEMLVKLGYTGIYDIGGIIDWPYETVK